MNEPAEFNFHGVVVRDLRDIANAQQKLIATLIEDKEALRVALEKWRAAREAFLELPPVGSEPDKRVPPRIWNALATGEQELYVLATAIARAEGRAS